MRTELNESVDPMKFKITSHNENIKNGTVVIHSETIKGVIVKCLNCVKKNKSLNFCLDKNYNTNNRDPPAYQNELILKYRRMGLEI